MEKPESAITITEYSKLHQFVRAFADNKINLLILVGRPGTQKSRSIKNALTGHTVHWIVGEATALGLYMSLHAGKDKPIIIDDVDGLYEDRAAVRLLKTLCNTEAVKSVSWESAGYRLEAEKIPKQFDTKSKLCLIANRWRALNVNVEAIQDRGHLVFFEPNALEIHKRVAQGRWFHDREVFDWIGRHLHLIPQPSMRQYVLAEEKKDAGMDWRLLMLHRWLTDKVLLAAIELKLNRSLTQAQRIEEFDRLGYGKKSTYYRKCQEFALRLQGMPLDEIEKTQANSQIPTVSEPEVSTKKSGQRVAPR